ncbi:hypothetical protein ECANGB1_1369 [Enterospora canceri]|uniref:MULE transposase domain-containing protein n=1 Tax=Enterospora canceri TaxID=1081671 RepID=A0A1Y1S6Y2_9MICR|nr:hypothetical protein ECANGB1_1369 [Enterospora canceri]
MLTVGGKRFYQFGPNNTRDIVDSTNIIVFFAENMIEPLRAASTWSIFEMTAIIAFSTVFPNARMIGCMFHLAQSVQRKLDSSCFASEYTTNLVVKRYAQALNGLNGIISMCQSNFLARIMSSNLRSAD